MGVSMGVGLTEAARSGKKTERVLIFCGRNLASTAKIRGWSVHQSPGPTHTSGSFAAFGAPNHNEGF